MRRTSIAAEPSVYFLLWPRLRSAANVFSKGAPKDRIKNIFFGALTVFFWIVLFTGALMFFQRVASEEPFGPFLVHKLLSFLFIIFFAVLIFSHVVTSLNSHFLSEDLPIYTSAPVSAERLFSARFFLALAFSSWMVMVFGLPVLIACGVVLKAPWFYYPWMMVNLVTFCFLPCAAASILTMLLVKTFPARKTQDVLIILAIVVIIILYFLFRFVRPEQLFNPDIFHGFAEYFATLSAPSNRLFPSTWAVEALAAGLAGKLWPDGFFYLGLQISWGMAAIVISGMLASKIYFSSFTKAQEGRKAGITGRRGLSGLMDFASSQKMGVFKPVAVKDMLSFFRETTQWTQLLLLMALIVVYLYNFRVLHLERISGITSHVRNLVALVNLILAGFVLSAVSVRFVLPAVSLEGRAIWIIKSAPVSIGRFIWVKYFINLPFMIIMGQLLVIISNIFLDTSSIVSFIGSFAMAEIAIAATGLAVGLGAILPNFEERNVARMATSFSAIIYMVSATALVGFLAGLTFTPAKLLYKSSLTHIALSPRQWAIIGLSMVLSLLLTILAVIWPISKGIDSLSKVEV